MRLSPERLRFRRFQAGLTQLQLAEKAGLSQRYISSLERGARQGGIRGIAKLAKALDVTPEHLCEPAPLEQAG